jgi:hypothetical protein
MLRAARVQSTVNVTVRRPPSSVAASHGMVQASAEHEFGKFGHVLV